MIAVKDPIAYGKVYRGERIILRWNPLPIEVVGERFWKIVEA